MIKMEISVMAVIYHWIFSTEDPVLGIGYVYVYV